MSSSNPAINHTIAGRARRWVIHSVESVAVRLDLPSKSVLEHLKQVFAGAEPADTVSNSMIFRRALGMYHRHVGGLLSDPQHLAAERVALTQNTQTPRKSQKGQAHARAAAGRKRKKAGTHAAGV